MALQQVNRSDSQLPSINQIEKTVNLLDKGVKLPVLPLRFPLDPILGIVPFLGDVFTLLISGSIIAQARKHSLPKNAQSKMVFNVLIDCIIGCIPFFGDIFDFFYKANMKNLAILKHHIGSQSQKSKTLENKLS